MARGYCQCLSRCLCITVPHPPVFRHHVFLPPPPPYSVTTYFSPTYSVTTYFSPTYSDTTYFPPTYSVTTYFPPTYSDTTYPDLHPATTTTTATDELLLGRYDLLLERYRLQPYYYYYLSGTPLNILWA